MALRAVDEPELVLLDLNLPRMDGFEVCRRLRADPLTATLPVIVLTGHTSIEDMVAALDAGADDFLAKPFQQAELLARMRSAFRLRRAITSLERATQIVAALANAVEAKDEASSTTAAGWPTMPRGWRRRSACAARSSRRSPTARCCTTWARSACPSTCCARRGR
jgi:DNA-binding response OmpR family regulator